MKNLDKIIEARVNEILRVKRILFILDIISNSKTSVTQNLEDFKIPKSTYEIKDKIIFSFSFAIDAKCLWER
jgi:hypothetical protein